MYMRETHGSRVLLNDVYRMHCCLFLFIFSLPVAYRVNEESVEKITRSGIIFATSLKNKNNTLLSS